MMTPWCALLEEPEPGAPGQPTPRPARRCRRGAHRAQVPAPQGRSIRPATGVERARKQLACLVRPSTALIDHPAHGRRARGPPEPASIDGVGPVLAARLIGRCGRASVPDRGRVRQLRRHRSRGGVQRRTDPPPALPQRRPQAQLGARGPRSAPAATTTERSGQDPQRGHALQPPGGWLADEQQPSCPDTVPTKPLDTQGTLGFLEGRFIGFQPFAGRVVGQRRPPRTRRAGCRPGRCAAAQVVVPVHPGEGGQLCQGPWRGPRISSLL